MIIFYELNKNILDSTFNADVKRLRYALEQTAGVKWDKGENNKQVECVTIDTRQICNNPFFSLYQDAAYHFPMPSLRPENDQGIHRALCISYVMKIQKI